MPVLHTVLLQNSNTNNIACTNARSFNDHYVNVIGNCTTCYDWLRKPLRKTKKFTVRVNDVVTDQSYAFAGFLVSTLFCVSPAHA